MSILKQLERQTRHTLLVNDRAMGRDFEYIERKTSEFLALLAKR